MLYKTRPGVELVHICGSHLLIASRPAWAFCPKVTEITRGAALAWSLLEKGKSLEAITQFLAIMSRRPIYEMQDQLDDLLEKLVAQGYLLMDDSDDEYGYYDKDMK
ncbi:MAG: hypothetical protein IJ212_02705 [Bacteroidaceae bacterium]|nr:hypothetical protein [Bacteroidaceae bacterium]